MARFFFDTADANGICSDDEGCECADTEVARRLARRALCEMARDKSSIHEAAVYTVRVRDAAGAPIYEATLTLTGARA